MQPRGVAPMPGTATDSASAIFRDARSLAGFPQLPVTTLYELFDRSVGLYKDLPCLGQRPVKVGRVPVPVL